MQFLFLRALKPYVTLLFAGMLLFTTGCEDDDHDHDHGHHPYPHADHPLGPVSMEKSDVKTD